MEGAEDSGAAAPPLPNLAPRHRQLIPTPCGPIKPCSELSFPVKIYFCVTILSLLSVIGLTIETLVQQTEEDVTISLIQLVGVVIFVPQEGKSTLPWIFPIRASIETYVHIPGSISIK